MAVIFSASNDQLSFQHSSRIVAPLVRRLFPHLPEKTVGDIVFGVRKGAHVAEYGVLALLFWYALRRSAPQGGSSWRWPLAGCAAALVTLFAASDEIHQAFVPSRQGCFTDVLLDISGAALALLSLWAIGRWRKKW